MNLNKTIDEYRTNKKQIQNIKRTSTLSDLIDSYFLSNDFNMLRDSSKHDYKYFLEVLRGLLAQKSLWPSQAEMQRYLTRGG